MRIEKHPCTCQDAEDAARHVFWAQCHNCELLNFLPKTYKKKEKGKGHLCTRPSRYQIKIENGN